MTERKNQMWELDLVGPFPISQDGYKYILTKIDHYTRVGDAIPIKNNTANEVVKAVEKLFIRKGEVPEKILMDNGLEFKNKLMSRLSEIKGFTIKHSSPYHPQTTGAVERFNGTLTRKLKKISKFGSLIWKTCLEKTLFAYNNSLSRPLGLSPYELESASRKEFHIDKKFGVKSEKNDVNRKIERLAGRLQRYRREFSSGKERKNKFQVGDIVWYYDVPYVPDKLGTKWVILGTVVEARGGGYVIKDAQGNKIRANENNLRKQVEKF